MHAFALPLVIYYFLVITVVCIYGLHRYWIVWVFYRTRPHPRKGSSETVETAERHESKFDELPSINRAQRRRRGARLMERENSEA